MVNPVRTYRILYFVNIYDFFLPRMFQVCTGEDPKPGHWYHFCFSLKNLFNIQKLKVMVNGKVCLDRTYVEENVSAFTPMNLSRFFTIGEYPTLSPDASASGKVTDFNIWNRSLSQTEMDLFTMSCNNPKNKSGKYPKND